MKKRIPAAAGAAVLGSAALAAALIIAPTASEAEGPAAPSGTTDAAASQQSDVRAITAQAKQFKVSRRTHIFYYPWYGNPTRSEGWIHWQQGGNNPPGQIGSQLYPVLGAYDSGDPVVLAQHMQWIREAGAGVLVSSWWGQGSREDGMLPGILDAAAAAGLKVSFHIEPYDGRTPEKVVSDVNYLINKYGSHPAFYRAKRYKNKPVIYIWAPDRSPDWSPIWNMRKKAILMAQTTDGEKVGSFRGMYSYGAGAQVGAEERWKTASQWGNDHRKVWAPSVNPGFDDRRAMPGTDRQLNRRGGATYDDAWKAAIGSRPDFVTITSFNEWHENTQIEPAMSFPDQSHGISFDSYQGSYNRQGVDAEKAYIYRTAKWVKKYKKASKNY